MKKVSQKTKLSLGKATITKLNESQMGKIMGGSQVPSQNTAACWPTCFVSQGTTACCA